MRCSKGCVAMAGKALASIERGALLRGRRVVRIVAACAGHFVAACALALAHAELLNFAYAAPRCFFSLIDEKREVVGDGIAGLVIDC